MKINRDDNMAYSKKQIEDIFKSVCDRIEKGEPLRTILKDKDMPSSRTFFKWLDEDEVKVKQYARVTELRADKIFDEIMEIADTPVEGEETTIKTTGIEVKRGDMLGHRRLQIDARKWYLSKMFPKKYGDKLEHDHRSGDGSMTPHIHLNYKGKDINLEE